MVSTVTSLFPLQSAEVGKHTFERRVSLPLKPNCLWRIEKGIVRTLTWLEDGTVFTLGIWGPGDVVGRVLSKTDPYQIECLTQVEVSVLPPDSWHKTTDALIAHVQQVEELAVIRSYRRVEDALLRLLLWLVKRFGREVERGHLLDLRLTHQDLAELLGSTRVTVTRVINQLEQQGFIQRLPRQQIIVQEGELWHYEI